MTTMIEKVARAICPEAWSDTNDSGLSGKDADAHYQIIRRWAYAKARAALSTMLEPSKGQMVAGARIHPSAYMGYQAMIQAALDEKEG